MSATSYGISTIGGGVLVLLAAFLPPAAAAAEATCDGRPATIVGSDGADSLTGTSGDDVVWLGAGFDSFRGGAGDDIVCGGPGRDSLYGGSGDDRLYGGPGDDSTVAGSAGTDVVHGGDGDDRWLRGDDFDVGDDSDRVFGDAGDDVVAGESGQGSDLADGGPGRDRIGFYGQRHAVHIDLRARTVTGDAVDTIRGFEVHWGSEHDDTLVGSARGDALHGIGGHDTVSGRGGPDTLSAQSGTIAGGGGRDAYVAADESTRGLRVDLGAGDDRARFGGTMRDTTVRGGPGNDVFRFPDPIASLDSDGVRALLRGSRGTDRLTFAHNSHRVRVDVRARLGTWTRNRITFTNLEEFHGSKRSDRLLGSSAADHIVGHRGDDVLRGRGGRDRLHGREGRDVAYGGSGPDVIRGGKGRDLLHGGKGQDVLRGDKGRDKAYGDRGRDRCSAEVRVSC